MNNQTLSKATTIFKALSEPSRLSIVYWLSLGELNVSSIAEKVQMEQSSVSHQLKILKAARLIKSRKEGKTRIYSLLDNHIYELINQVINHVEEKEYPYEHL